MNETDKPKEPWELVPEPDDELDPKIFVPLPKNEEEHKKLMGDIDVSYSPETEYNNRIDFERAMKEIENKVVENNELSRRNFEVLKKVYFENKSYELVVEEINNEFEERYHIEIKNVLPVLSEMEKLIYEKTGYKFPIQDWKIENAKSKNPETEKMLQKYRDMIQSGQLKPKQHSEKRDHLTQKQIDERPQPGSKKSWGRWLKDMFGGG